MTTRTPATQPLGLGHGDHPLLGRRVVDHAHDDRVGVLRAIAPDVKDNNPGFVLRVPNTPLVAWLALEGGGVEWTTAPDAIEAAE
ncbi:hypothetical protein DY245_15170 [Streptomyces inhibens]|uniref:Uncharacterized protein n=1 Tax=Streptomyces inhibens TaxID=2293571 RepID=A0A371Q498_STRIH|nr:hypothetical protein [Streptomyces inhibens]REK89534.1 hypothetical protein DY245_15170 [Streptomyces inhibens]